MVFAKRNSIFEVAKIMTMRATLIIAFCFFISTASWAGNETNDSSLNSALMKRVTMQGRAPGQPLKIFNGVSLGGGVGVNWFLGDLADHKIIPAPADWGEAIGTNWSLYLRKEFKYGIGAKIQFDKGDLQGNRVIGAESPRVYFETDYMGIMAQLSYNVLTPIFGERKKLRYYLNAEIGAGITFYRSLTTWGEGPALVRDFEGYTTDDKPATQRYANMDRASMANTINIPMGLTFGYMLNHRVDATAQVMLNNTLTDRLETWARDHTANDKYVYATIGVRFNFNRTDSDMPKRKKKRSKKSDRDSASPNELDLGTKLKPIKGFKGGQDREKELMNAMIRMYELQLQLFQLQYLAK